jgi:hypothetical protein
MFRRKRVFDVRSFVLCERVLLNDVERNLYRRKIRYPERRSIVLLDDNDGASFVSAS